MNLSMVPPGANRLAKAVSGTSRFEPFTKG